MIAAFWYCVALSLVLALFVGKAMLNPRREDPRRRNDDNPEGGAQ